MIFEYSIACAFPTWAQNLLSGSVGAIIAVILTHGFSLWVRRRSVKEEMSSIFRVMLGKAEVENLPPDKLKDLWLEHFDTIDRLAWQLSYFSIIPKDTNMVVVAMRNFRGMTEHTCQHGNIYPKMSKELIERVHRLKSDLGIK